MVIRDLSHETVHFVPEFMTGRQSTVETFWMWTGCSIYEIMDSLHCSHIHWKTRKNKSTFSSQGILDILKMWANFYPKYWKSEGILPKIPDKWGNFYPVFIFIFTDFLIEPYLLNLKKYWKSQGNFSVRKCRNHVFAMQFPSLKD